MNMAQRRDATRASREAFQRFREAHEGLTANEWALVSAMRERAGEPVSHAELGAALGYMEGPYTRYLLIAHISNIRRKGHEIITYLRGYGVPA